MNITSEELYWLTRLDYFRFACAALLAITVIVWFTICVCLAEENRVWGILTTTIVSLITVLSCVVGLVFIPTTKEMAMIKVVPAIVNSDFMQKDLPDDAKQIYELGKKAVVDYLEGEKK